MTNNQLEQKIKELGNFIAIDRELTLNKISKLEKENRKLKRSVLVVIKRLKKQESKCRNIHKTNFMY